MDQYVGLDVSLKETWISVRQNRKRIWRGKCLSHPQAVADAIRQHAPDAGLVGFETGALSTCFYHDLTAAGLPAVCIDPPCQGGARHGAEQDRCERCRRSVAARRGRVLPR